MKRASFWMIVLIFAVILPALAQTRRVPRVQRVKAEVVTLTPQVFVRRYTGTLYADRITVLSFRVGGPLIEVQSAAGKTVRAGDVLMRIDPRDYQQSVDAAQARLDVARAQLNLMKVGARDEDIRIYEARISSAKAQRDYARAEYERAAPLLRKNAISGSEVDLMLSNVRVANAQIASLEQELKKARQGEREEEIRVKEAEIAGLEVNLRIAKSQLDDTYLRAPFDGIVASQNINNYEIIRPGSPIVTMMDISKLDVEIWIPEREILRSHSPHEAVSAVVTFPNLPGREFSATLKEAETEANPKTKAWRVKFTMKNPKEIDFLPGMSANVRVRVKNLEDTGMILVPISAVLSDNANENYVWTFDPHQRASRRKVELGRIYNSRQVEILTGLQPGEKIVVSGAPFIKEGDTLKEVSR